MLRPGDLTPTDMAELMQKLASNFGGKKDLEARTSTYYEKLERFPVDVVRRAVDRVLDETHKYFPLLGHIKKHCVEIEQELGIVDTGSPRALMRAWLEDPYRGVRQLEADSPAFAAWKADDLPSDPCPVCGEQERFSPRGMVIVHDDAKHTETHVDYSNVGRPEWFDLGPPVPLPPLPSRPRTPNPYPKQREPVPVAGAIAAAVEQKLLPPAVLEQGDAYEATP